MKSPFLGNLRAETQKLWKRSAIRMPPLDPTRSINLPTAPLIHPAGRRPDRKRVRG
jgi:hypothetical protein